MTEIRYTEKNSPFNEMKTYLLGRQLTFAIPQLNTLTYSIRYGVDGRYKGIDAESVLLYISGHIFLCICFYDNEKILRKY